MSKEAADALAASPLGRRLAHLDRTNVPDVEIPF